MKFVRKDATGGSSHNVLYVEFSSFQLALGISPDQFATNVGQNRFSESVVIFCKLFSKYPPAEQMQRLACC